MEEGGIVGAYVAGGWSRGGFPFVVSVLGRIKAGQGIIITRGITDLCTATTDKLTAGADNLFLSVSKKQTPVGKVGMQKKG